MEEKLKKTVKMNQNVENLTENCIESSEVLIGEATSVRYDSPAEISAIYGTASIICKAPLSEEGLINSKLDILNSFEHSSELESIQTSSSSSSFNIEDPDFMKKIEDKLKDIPEVLVLFRKLEAIIMKQRKKLKKLKSKLKKKKKIKTSATQTSLEDFNFSQSKTDTNTKTFSEEITEAAEQAMQSTGFVYEETSGLYYDYNTGYYYNAEYGLYYDAKTGTYMSYNPESQTYEFHSQVEIPTNSNTATQCKTMKNKREKERDKEQATKKARRSPSQENGKEEGECSDGSLEFERDFVSGDEKEIEEVLNQWPPCMRIIVEETTVPSIKLGTLFLVTYEGGTLGREGKHDVLIPDINVSKHHLKFHFNKDSSCFFITDLGSRNGTILNGKRMSSSQQESEAFQVAHGSRIQVGGTILLCHVHEGNRTCGHCEPGLVQKVEKKEIFTYNKSKEHKKELMKLRKKFAVEKCEESCGKLKSNYIDRAQVRRDTVGSFNHNEKTEVASVNEAISSENKGFKLLSKMGWSSGDSLGKTKTSGILEPVPLVSNIGTTGLGSEIQFVDSDTNRSKQIKREVLQKTKERFNRLPEKTESKFELESE